MVVTDHHRRCRFWPHCAVHLGRTRPRRGLTDTNAADMADLRERGWTWPEIAAAFDTSTGTAARLVHRHHQSDPPARRFHRDATAERAFKPPPRTGAQRQAAYRARRAANRPDPDSP